MPNHPQRKLLVGLAASAVILAGTADAANTAMEAAAGMTTPVYAVVHVDIAPKQVQRALPLLQAYARQAGSDPAVRRIEVTRQIGAPNHFTLLEVLQSQEAYDRFVDKPYVKTMRVQLQPLLGSPFDERLHTAVELQ